MRQQSGCHPAVPYSKPAPRFAAGERTAWAKLYKSELPERQPEGWLYPVYTNSETG
jgi:hypothetical protein